MLTQYDSLDRLSSIKRLAPDIFNNKKVLYIGASRLRFQFSEQLKKSCVIDVVEAFKDNANYLSSLGWLSNVFHCDILDFEPANKYEVILFWHCIEHLQQEKITPLLKKIENWATESIVIGCPFGFYEQGPVYGNDYETHLTHLYPEFFTDLGYTIECLGQKDTIGSNITAVKHKRAAL